MATSINFPTEDLVPLPSYPLDFSDWGDTSVHSQFENQSQLGMQVCTLGLRTWKLKWKNITNDQFLNLYNFINGTIHYSALTFFWSNPSDGHTYPVRFQSADDWSYDNAPGYWSGTITLHQEGAYVS